MPFRRYASSIAANGAGGVLSGIGLLLVEGGEGVQRIAMRFISFIKCVTVLWLILAIPPYQSEPFLATRYLG
jgi:hypothetical protein